MSLHRRSHRAAARGLVAGTAALTALGLATAAGASVPPEPAPDAGATAFTGHGQVVAQAAAALSGASHWTVTPETLAPGTPLTAPETPSFVAVTSGAAIPTSADGTALARIGAGEAGFLAPGTTLVAADGAQAGLLRLEIAPGDGDSPSATLGPPPGLYDIDIVRDVLAPGESLSIADSPAAPALIVAASGALTVAGAPSGSVDLTEGQSATLDGSLTLVNAGATPAVVLAGIVGPLVQTAPATDLPTTPTTAAPNGNESPEPTTPSAPDADSDGLSDEDEAAAMTDPQNPDSDGDGLTDGEEVHTYGTDPLSSRTDSDHLEDGLEIERGTDPLDEDTDDDGCQDSSDDNPLTGDGDCDGDTLSFDQERQLGTDPANPDTDGDGIDDDSDPQPLSPDNGGGGTPEATEAVAPTGSAP